MKQLIYLRFGPIRTLGNQLEECVLGDNVKTSAVTSWHIRIGGSREAHRGSREAHGFRDRKLDNPI